MASQFSRTDLLPAGLKAEQVELDGNTIRVHSVLPKPRLPVRAVARFRDTFIVGIGAALLIFPRTVGRWN